MNNFQDKANFIWQVADDILRGLFKQHEYGDVILPFVVLRRLDCVLEEKKDEVIKASKKFKDVLPDPTQVLLQATDGLKFYNTSVYDLKRLAQDAGNMELNFNNYINGFSKNVREIIENFGIEKIVSKLAKNDLLFMLVDKFTEIDLHPGRVKNHEMGYIFEELLRRFSEMSNETAGEHYNGSPLFTGDAGSGESNIRRWIIESDWLEAIIALPTQLFFNTGIATYIWIVTNKKPAHRRGKVQLVNAVGFFQKMRKSLGNKRNFITAEQIQEITDIYTGFVDGEFCKIFDNDDFGFNKVTVERPLMKDGKIVNDKKGNPKPDTSLRDYEKIPLKDDIETYFEREVFPHVPDAWMDRTKDKIGYEINFTKYFYKYQPLRPLNEIKADILALEQETEGLLKEILA